MASTRNEPPSAPGRSKGSRNNKMPAFFHSISRHITDERVDMLISGAKSVVGTAGNVIPDGLVPGLSQALSSVELILGKIQKMRTNTKGRLDTAESIETLQRILRSSLEETRDWRLSDMTLEHQLVQETVNAVDPLKARINGLLRSLGEIEQLATPLPRKYWWSRLFCVDQDAGLLSNIHSKVEEATKNFELQNGIAIERVLGDMYNHLRRVDHDRQLKVNEKNLNALRRSKDASYKSYYVEEKAKL
ncbi:hypothetical protein OBBRIDRAFT_103398 [Obba rivulosa]|uniref:Uncharacterized protein n=1 Tax=Obba rivulosa TaxID=1052685 RepID=A0A8E2DS53_9APHY|nr:hypothetical protein OBBRIDRAFT_103398 [Obba rivulosa]